MKRFSAALIATLSLVPDVATAARGQNVIHNIVLVHGAYADGSGWAAIARILQNRGYTVSVVQEPETSLSADVTATRLVLSRQTGPIVLVGHSYGGAVITEAGNDAHVARLVYVAAFAPDEGQTLKQLITSDPGLAAGDIAPIEGFLFVNQSRFPADFAADVPLSEARFMAISQVGQSASSAVTPITMPAWKTRPTYGIVATDDHMINPDLERKMYTRAHAKIFEIKGSHAVYISQPQAVANVIEEAAGEAQ